MSKENKSGDIQEKDFLINNPDQIPVEGDMLFHFSSDRIEIFRTEVPGSMYFSVKNDSTGLVGNYARVLHVISLKRDFDLSNFTTYLGYHKDEGWGVRLNQENTEAKWLSISNQLLEDYLEVVDVIELDSVPGNTKKTNPIPKEISERFAGHYLGKLMDPNVSDVELCRDQKSIEKLLTQLARGEIDPGYDIGKLKRRVEGLGWIFPLE